MDRAASYAVAARGDVPPGGGADCDGGDGAQWGRTG
ncbi:hypothetical protein FB157_11014 [Streptomyces sp. BK340]|nr:hypothetical protein FB157_11014 [Streptomyces sp. BK340]